MQTAKLMILLCCAYYTMASHYSHTIPVDEYETKLTFLGQHVEIPETPVKVIKITKTVAVKVPVPYPVKVVQKVPYPVHISKPYPVPVPQIVHVPAPAHKVANDDANSYGGGGAHEPHTYNVQENGPYDEHASNALSFGDGHSFNGASEGHEQHASDGHGQSYEAPADTYYGYQPGSDDGGSSESRSYDDAINLSTHNAAAAGNGGAGYHYH